MVSIKVQLCHPAEGTEKMRQIWNKLLYRLDTGQRVISNQARGLIVICLLS
jgi:hypothetical protein